jgi:tetratricopeptide (TPR) repeat protein
MLRITTLGRLRIATGATTLDLGLKPSLLLVYLTAKTKNRAAREELADLLWPGASGKKSRHSLSQALHTIRIVLGDCVHINNDAIELQVPVEWDYRIALNALATFAFCRALDFIPGPFLHTTYIAGGSLFEDWRTTLALDLRTAMETHYGRWYEVAKVQNDFLGIQTVNARLVTTFGWDKVRDLEIHPTRGNGDSVLGVVEDTLPMIGRAHEITTLLSRYREAKGGRPVHVGISGPSGIGKTKLAEAFIKAAEGSGARAIRVRCFEHDQTTGFRPLIQGLQSTQAEIHHLQEPWRSVVATAVNGEQTTSSVEQKPDFLIEGIIRYLEQLSAQATTILFIDDLQWAGPSLLKLLQHLLSGMRGAHLMVLLSSRPTAGSPVPALGIARNMECLSLKPLSCDDLLAASHSLPISQELAATAIEVLHTASTGHPFKLHQLIRAVSSGGPVWTLETVRAAASASVNSAVLHEINAATPNARNLLNAIAVCGRPTSFSVLKKITGLPTHSFLIALRELLSRQLICDERGRIGTKHDVIRETVIHHLSASEKRLLHRAAVRELLARNAPVVDLVPHYVAAGMRKKAYVGALQAARVGQTAGATTETDRFLQIASRASKSNRKRWALLWRRRILAADNSEFSKVLHLCRQIRLGGIPFSRGRSFELTVAELSAKFFTGQSSAKQLTREAEALLRATDSPDSFKAHMSALAFLVRLAIASSDDCRLKDLGAAFDQIAAERDDPAVYLEACSWAAYCRLYFGDVEGALEPIEQGISLARLHSEERTLCRMLSVQATLLAHRGNLEEAVHACDEGLAITEACGAIRGRLIFLANKSTILMEMADLDAAEGCLLDVLKTARSRDAVADVVNAYYNYSLVLLDRKDYDGAIRIAGQALEASARQTQVVVDVGSRAVIGLASLEIGRISEASMRFTEVLERDGTYYNNDVFVIEQFLARYRARTGQAASAIERLEAKIGRSDSRISTTCRAALQLELARLLMKIDSARSCMLATLVNEWATPRKAHFLANESRMLLNRLGRPLATVG